MEDNRSGGDSKHEVAVLLTGVERTSSSKDTDVCCVCRVYV